MNSLRRRRSGNQGVFNLNKSKRTGQELNVTVSKHAEKRLQQRGVSKKCVELVLAYGKRSYSKGALVYSMTKSGHEKAGQMQGDAYWQLSDKLDIYVVVSQDGDLITVARRIRRPRK